MDVIPGAARVGGEHMALQSAHVIIANVTTKRRPQIAVFAKFQVILSPFQHQHPGGCLDFSAMILGWQLVVPHENLL